MTQRPHTMIYNIELGVMAMVPIHTHRETGTSFLAIVKHTPKEYDFIGNLVSGRTRQTFDIGIPLCIPLPRDGGARSS